MWDLPGPGIKPVSPALAGGFLTTAPLREVPTICSFNLLESIRIYSFTTYQVFKDLRTLEFQFQQNVFAIFFKYLNSIYMFQIPKCIVIFISIINIYFYMHLCLLCIHHFHYFSILHLSPCFHLRLFSFFLKNSH